ncbi:transcriptional regulator SdiA [Pluralibacter gergoviae]
MWSNAFLSWRRELLQQFLHVTSSEQIHALLRQQAEAIEHDWYSLCIRQPVPFTRPKFSLQANYPQAWVNCYRNENFFAIDPVLKAENFCQRAVVWSDALFEASPALWDGARDFGLRAGFTHRHVLPNRAVGYLSFSRSGERASHSDEELHLRSLTLAELSLTSLLNLKDPQVVPPEIKFSNRELEIVKWTADGKTSAEIAMILSISENTVNFHQKNMQKKCNASNKTQVACYAAALGII